MSTKNRRPSQAKNSSPASGFVARQKFRVIAVFRLERERVLERGWRRYI